MMKVKFERKLITKLEDTNLKIHKYKKRPIIIRAVKLKEKMVIKTREGILMGYKGDYLIEGIKGEIYPCGREIFNETYDKLKKGKVLR